MYSLVLQTLQERVGALSEPERAYILVGSAHQILLIQSTTLELNLHRPLQGCIRRVAIETDQQAQTD
jgi:hypothetical protein